MGSWWLAFERRQEERARRDGDAGEAPAADVRIEVADKAGACFGVERALRLLEETVASSIGPVRTLGPIIHNPQVVRELEARGVDAVDRVPSDTPSTLVLRTHGTAPDVKAEALAAGLTVVDATCPYVQKAQRAAEELAREGRTVVVVGEAGHPEVDGILAHAPGAIAVADAEAAEALGIEGRVGLVAQTTQTPERYERVSRSLRERGVDVSRANTICLATRERQEAALELASRADLMIVIGGRNSANTSRLAALCAEVCPTRHIEGTRELDPRWFRDTGLVGVTAGASTPASQIESVVSAIEGMV